MKVTVNAWYSYEFPGKFTANLDEIGRPPIHAERLVDAYTEVRSAARSAFPYDDVQVNHHFDWENIHINTTVPSRKVKDV